MFDPLVGDDREALLYLLASISPRSPSAPAPATIHDLFEHTLDARLRTALIQALIALNDRGHLPDNLIDSNDLGVRRVDVEYRRNVGDPGLIDALIARIGGPDDFYVSLLGKIPIDSAHMAKLRTLLSNGTTLQKEQVACVLAMRDDTSRVVAILIDKDQAIRRSGADCAPFNPNAVEIAKATPRSVGEFPIEGFAGLQEQVSRKVIFEKQLDALPAGLRVWRVSMADATPGGWGLWGPGMRDWLEEKKYQLSRTTSASLAPLDQF